jgi:hypothetical protein
VQIYVNVTRVCKVCFIFYILLLSYHFLEQIALYVFTKITIFSATLDIVGIWCGWLVAYFQSSCDFNIYSADVHFYFYLTVVPLQSCYWALLTILGCGQCVRFTK